MILNHGYYVHIPGQLSRWGVVDVGKKCPHSCSFCYYMNMPYEDTGLPTAKPGDAMHKASWRDTAQLVRQVNLMADNGFLGFDLTGGEPAIHPGIFDIIAAATERGIASRMITLGQFLTGPDDRLSKLLAAGITDFLFSYHSPDPVTFNKITGGNLHKLTAAMDRLDEAGFDYTTNTTVTEMNFRELPALAASLEYRRTYCHNFIMHNAYYEWAEDGRATGVQAKYSEIAPYLRLAVDILERNGTAVNVRYAPLCSVAGLEKNYVGIVGVRHDPHEWMNCVEHQGPGDAEHEAAWIPMKREHPAPGAYLLGQSERGPFIGRGTEGGVAKVFTHKCQTCSAIAVCDGIDPNYFNRQGGEEFVPYCYDNRGSLLDRDRLAYLPGHVVKLKPKGEPRDATQRMLDGIWQSSQIVSIVIPNFNHADTIVKCLDSIDAQTCLIQGDRIGVIVVDDASTDDSRKVIAAYRPKNFDLRMVFRETNAGLPATPRNEGLEKVGGALMMVLDPDDYLTPTYLEEALRLFRDRSDISIVYPGIECFGMEVEQWAAVPFDREQEVKGNFIGYMAIYRREVFEEVGGYDESPELRGCEDWNFWVSACRLGFIAAPLPRQLVRYCRSETGLFESDVKPNFQAKRLAVYQRNQEIYPIEFLQEFGLA